jgi:hypothetical protein
MTYRILLKKLQQFSNKELSQKVVLFYGDGGTYSEVIDINKTKEDNENLGCEKIDHHSNWKKGQIFLIHSC